MSEPQKLNSFYPPIYLKAMLWGNGLLLTAWVCFQLLMNNIVTPLMYLVMILVILACYVFVIYKNPQLNQLVKVKPRWWVWGLVLAGYIFIRTKVNSVELLYLLILLFLNGIYFWNYRIAKKQNEKKE